MRALDELEKTIGVAFQDHALLVTAVVHSSYLNENPASAREHNERLEFLGDAVLGLIIAEKVYREFPGLTEGQMTRRRAALVRRDALVRVAGKIGLGDYLYLGKGEEGGGGRLKEANLAGAMEAVIAAVYLDGGLDTTREFIGRFWKDEFARTAVRGVEVDAKTRLQEVMQSRQQLTPHYRLLEAIGPDHARTFTVAVFAGNDVLGTGSGKSKKAAETAAARAALESFLPGDEVRR
ncbi:MAG: ribonuclease III [Chloroflexota bacterium]